MVTKENPRNLGSFFAFVYFVPFVVKLFPVNYGRPLIPYPLRVSRS